MIGGTLEQDLLQKMAALREALQDPSLMRTTLSDGSAVIVSVGRGVVASLNETAQTIVAAILTGANEPQDLSLVLSRKYDVEGVDVMVEIEGVLNALACLGGDTSTVDRGGVAAHKAASGDSKRAG